MAHSISFWNIVTNKPYVRGVLLFGLFSLALFLRIYDLENLPSQINQDELSNIYDAYSIVETGADRWGVKHPVILRAFGENDYRPPLYSWLAAGTIKLFGYSVFAGRLPSVILGMASLLLLYLTSKKIGGRMFAGLTLFIATISPWHITMSRLALEAAVLSSFFIILTIYLWIKVRESDFRVLNLIYLSLCIGLATNAYQSTKLIFFLIAVIVFIDLARRSRDRVKNVSLLIFFIAIGASPQLYAAIVMPQFFFSRAADAMMPFTFSAEYLFQLIRNFYLNLSPEYLFSKIGNYNSLTIARLLQMEFLFFYVGLFLFYWKFKNNKLFSPGYIYLLIIISILPSALTYDNPNALRASCNLILFPMFSAAGVLSVSNLMRNQKLQILLFGSIVFLFLTNSVYNFVKYIGTPELSSAGQQSLLVKLSEKINTYKDDYDKIYIEDLGNQPYIYIVGYCGISPQQFQRINKKIDRATGWDHFLILDKYYFLDKRIIKKIADTDRSKRKKMFVFKLKDDRYNLIDSINVHDQRIYFYSN